MERLPSGTCVSDLPHAFRPGFEAFPAVYRTPSLFWHRPGYEFPGVRGRPCKAEAFAAHIPVSLTDGLPLDPVGSLPFPSGGLIRPRFWGGAEVLRFTATLLRGLGFFSLPSLTARAQLFFSGSTGWRMAHRPEHRLIAAARSLSLPGALRP